MDVFKMFWRNIMGYKELHGLKHCIKYNASIHVVLYIPKHI